MTTFEPNKRLAENIARVRACLREVLAALPAVLADVHASA